MFRDAIGQRRSILRPTPLKTDADAMVIQKPGSSLGLGGVGLAGLGGVGLAGVGLAGLGGVGLRRPKFSGVGSKGIGFKGVGLKDAPGFKGVGLKDAPGFKGVGLKDAPGFKGVGLKDAADTKGVPKVKGVASLASPLRGTPQTQAVSVRSAFIGAKARAQQRNRGRKYKYEDEVIILGERVRLNEKGINPDVLARQIPFAEFVYFTNNYYPRSTEMTKLEKAKEIFSRVFREGSGFNLQDPIPPCVDLEFQLLKEGLEHRFKTLRLDVLARGNTYGDSLYTRQGIEQFLRLKKVIQDMEEEDTKCGSYEVGHKVASGRSLETIDNERVQNLLRQFSFLVLQATNPNEHYNQFMTIDPVELIEKLEEQTMDKETFIEFLAEYQDSKAPIPPMIAKVLEATQTQENVFDLMLVEEVTKIVGIVREVIEDATKTISEPFAAEFKELADRIQGSDGKEQLKAYMEWLLTHYSTSTKELAESRREVRARGDNVNQLTRQVADATTAVEKARIDTAEAEGKLASSVAAATVARTAEAASETALDDYKEKHASELEDAQQRIETSRALLAEAQATKSSLEEQLATVNAQGALSLKEKTKRVDNLQNAFNQIQAKLRDSQLGSEALKTRIRNLEQQLETTRGSAARATIGEQTERINMEQKIDDLEDRIADLNREKERILKQTGAGIAGTSIQALEREIGQLTRELTELRTQRQANAEAAGEKDVAIRERDATIEALQRQIETLRRFTDERAEISEGRESNSIRDMRQEAQELATTLRDREAALAAAQDRLAKQQEDIEQFSTARARLEQLISGLRAQLSGKNSEQAPLITQLELLQGQLGSRDENIRRLQSEIGTSQGEIQALRDQIRAKEEAFEGQKRILLDTNRLKNFEAQSRERLEEERGTLRSRIEELVDQAASQDAAMVSLRGRLAAAGKEGEGRTALEEEQAATKQQLKELRSTLESAQAELAAYDMYLSLQGLQRQTRGDEIAKISRSAAAQQAGLLGKIRTMAAEIDSKAPRPADEVFGSPGDKPFMDLYEKMLGYADRVRAAGATKKTVASRDICYLNYFITFFVKQLFFTAPELEQKKELLRKVTGKLEQFIQMKGVNSQQLLSLMNQVYDLLFASETFFLTQQRRDGAAAGINDVGYYVLVDSSSPADTLLADFYEFLGAEDDLAEITTSLETYIPQAFPDFFFKGTTVQFSVPAESNPDEDSRLYKYPGFTFLRSPRDLSEPSLGRRFFVIDKANDYSKTQVDLTTKEGAAFVQSQLTDKTPFQYTTLFSFFIIIAKQYLISVEPVLNQYQCSLSTTLKDPFTIQERERDWRALEMPMQNYASVLVPSGRNKRLTWDFTGKINTIQEIIRKTDELPELGEVKRLKADIETWKPKAQRDKFNEIAKKYNELVTNFRTTTGESIIGFYGKDIVQQISGKS